MKIRTSLLLLTLMLTASCGNNQGTSPPDPSPTPAGGAAKLKQDAKDVVTTAAAYLVQQKDQLQKSLAHRITDFDKRLSDLKAKSAQTSDQAKSEWANTLARLQLKRQAAAEKLEKLKDGAVDKWQEFKTGAERAVADLETALKDALARS